MSRILRHMQRKSYSAVSKNICNITFHMGLHTEVPFLYRLHISTVIHFKTSCYDTHLYISDAFLCIMYSQEKWQVRGYTQ